MAKKIIVVDDQADDGIALAETLAYVVDLLTRGEVTLVAMTGRVISAALPDVKTEAGKIIANPNDNLSGFLVDLVDRRDKEGGLKLCKQLKADRALKNYPVVIYTSKYTMINGAHVKAAGAQGFIKRDEYRHVENLTEAILTDFGLDHLIHH